MYLTLPYPPSVNHYWRHVGNRVLVSKAGRAYRLDVQAELMRQGVKPIQGRLGVNVLVYPPDARRRDLDNVLKSLLDALQAGGLYEDDSQIDKLCVRRGDVGGDCVCVTVEELPDA